MKSHARTICLLACTWIAAGCQSPRGEQLAGRLIAEVMTGSQVSNNLRALAVPGGRLSGSPNAAKAEQYVLDKLLEYGLSNVHFEPFRMITWRDRSTAVTVLGDPPQRLDVVQALGNSLSTPPEGITGELVDVGKGTREEFEAKKELLAGRFALAHYGDVHRSRKMKYALQHGALGLFHISHLEDQVVVGTCHDTPDLAPGVAICLKDGEELSRRLAAGETIRVNVKIEADAWEASPRNVVGEIPGRGLHADEVVIVCAHLDSWHLAEGAIDNGSGSAVILEAARALVTVGPPPRRTIRFVWFMGEEHGLHGSEAYVEAHRDELDRVVAVVNLDMPGEPRTFVTYGHPEVVQFLRAVGDALPGYELSKDVRTSTSTFSDHAPFMRAGVCALAIAGDCGPGVKHYHTPGDTYKAVDRRGLNGCAAVLSVLARCLADADPAPAQRFDPGVLAGKDGW